MIPKYTFPINRTPFTSASSDDFSDSTDFFYYSSVQVRFGATLRRFIVTITHYKSVSLFDDVFTVLSDIQHASTKIRDLVFGCARLSAGETRELPRTPE